MGEYKGQDFHVELPKALAGVLLKQIIERMKETAEGRARHKYFAVSAVCFCIYYFNLTLKNTHKTPIIKARRNNNGSNGDTWTQLIRL